MLPTARASLRRTLLQQRSFRLRRCQRSGSWRSTCRNGTSPSRRRAAVRAEDAGGADHAPLLTVFMKSATAMPRRSGTTHPTGTDPMQSPAISMRIPSPLVFRKAARLLGDAALLDFIYGHPSVQPMLMRQARWGRKFTPSPASVAGPALRCVNVAIFWRNSLMTLHLRGGGEAEILTIAAGHLREGAMSQALKNKTIKRWLTLDQDPSSLGPCQRIRRHSCRVGQRFGPHRSEPVPRPRNVSISCMLQVSTTILPMKSPSSCRSVACRF